MSQDRKTIDNGLNALLPTESAACLAELCHFPCYVKGLLPSQHLEESLSS